MKPKTIIPLIIGLGVGFFAIKMGVDMVRKAKGSQEGRVGVLVTATPVEVATAIHDSMLTVREVAVSLVPRDSFTNKEDLVGRVTKIPVPAGVPISRQMLAPLGAEPGLTARIPPGYRAVTVSVNEESAVAGFIRPGSSVDVSVVYGRTDTRSRLILSNVEVGAVGQSMSQTSPDGKTVRMAKSVTLFLTPEQVQTLNTASGGGKGRIRLALRGHDQDPPVAANPLSDWLKGMVASRSKRPEPIEQPLDLEPEEEVKERLHTVVLRRGETEQRLLFGEDGCLRAMVTPSQGALPAGMVRSNLGSRRPKATEDSRRNRNPAKERELDAEGDFLNQPEDGSQGEEAESNLDKGEPDEGAEENDNSNTESTNEVG